MRLSFSSNKSRAAFKRLRDVEATHQARFVGQSFEADLAMQRLTQICGHHADAPVERLQAYVDYKHAVRPLAKSIFGMVA